MEQPKRESDAAPGLNHVQQRALDRFGILLTIADINSLCRQCRTGESVLLRKLPTDSGPSPAESHLVKYSRAGSPDTILPVVWVPGRNIIVTVLPESALTSKGRIEHSKKLNGKSKRHGRGKQALRGRK